jgi:hypothetical protein
MKIPRRVRSAIWAMTSCEGRAVIRVTGEVDVDRSGMLRGSLDSLLRIVTDEDFSGLAANLADVTLHVRGQRRPWLRRPLAPRDRDWPASPRRWHDRTSPGTSGRVSQR